MSFQMWKVNKEDASLSNSSFHNHSLQRSNQEALMELEYGKMTYNRTRRGAYDNPFQPRAYGDDVTGTPLETECPGKLPSYLL